MEKKFNYFSRCPIYVSKEHEEHIINSVKKALFEEISHQSLFTKDFDF